MVALTGKKSRTVWFICGPNVFTHVSAFLIDPGTGGSGSSIEAPTLQISSVVFDDSSPDKGDRIKVNFALDYLEGHESWGTRKIC